MAFTLGLNDVLTVRGTLDVSSGTLTLKDGQIPIAKLTQVDNVLYPISFFDGRVWNDLDALLPGTAVADDLGIFVGTAYGTDGITLRTIDQKANTTPTAAYARFLEPVPRNWVSGQSLSIRVLGGMVTNVSDTTATVGLNVYVPDGDGTVGSDLCATAVQSINSGLLSAGATTCDFVITSTSLVQGDILDIRLAVTIEDGATGSAVIGAVSKLAIMADVKG